MTFVEFMRWLASTAATGVVASYVVQAIKLVFPQVQDEVAVRVSVIVAAVVALAAYLVLPYMQQLPPVVEQIWPIIAWLASYIWFEIVLKKPRTEEK